MNLLLLTPTWYVFVLAALLAWLGRAVVLPPAATPNVEVEPRLAADVVRGAAVLWQAGVAHGERLDAFVDDMRRPLLDKS